MALKWVRIANLKGPMGPAGDVLSAGALQAAVDAASAYVTAGGFVSAELTTADRFEIGVEGGTTLSVGDLEGAPYFTNAPGVQAEKISRDSLEWWEEGRLLAAIDDLSGTPHLRNGATGANAGFTETHFIILAGQSNAVGSSSPAPVGTNNPLPNLFTVPQRGVGAGVEVQAVQPLQHPYSDANSSTVAHGWTVARRYALDNPGVKVVVLPMANSGTGFFLDSTGYTWAPSRVGEAGIQNLYSLTISKSNTAIAQYRGVRRVAMILWHQGEADAVGETTRAAYEAELDALIAGFRANITGATDAPFIIGQLGWEFRNTRAPGTHAQIDAAHKGTPARVKRTAFAPAPGEGFMRTDNTHFTARGQSLLAQSILNVLPDAHFNL